MGASLNLEILRGGGLKQFWKSRLKGAGVKKRAFRPGGVDFCWNNPLLQKNVLYFQIFHVINLFLDAKCIFVV